MKIKRREFLTGLLASTLIPNAFAQSRKEIFINGKRIKTVDIHAHASIKEVERVIAGTPVERTIGLILVSESSSAVLISP